MPNWNKIAEAFGRAMHNRARFTDHAPLTNKGFNKALARDAAEDERFRRSAANAGAEEEFRRGFNDEELLPDRGSSPSLIRNERLGDFVDEKDLATADREQAEFDKIFDDAINKAVATHSGGTSGPEIERSRANIRRQAIEMLKNDNYDISDVLDFLRGE